MLTLVTLRKERRSAASTTTENDMVSILEF
jgi:hypothetical protein